MERKAVFTIIVNDKDELDVNVEFTPEIGQVHSQKEFEALAPQEQFLLAFSGRVQNTLEMTLKEFSGEEHGNGGCSCGEHCDECDDDADEDLDDDDVIDAEIEDEDEEKIP